MNRLADVEPIRLSRVERNVLGQYEFVNIRHPEWGRPLLTDPKVEVESAMDGEHVTVISANYIERDDGHEDVFICRVVFSVLKREGQPDEFGHVVKGIFRHSHEGLFEEFQAAPRSVKLAFLGY